MFDDLLNKPLKELGLHYSKFDKQSMILSDVIEKPKWKHYASKTKHSASKTLIPDIISINNDMISIYDAKYYKIILNEKDLKNYPGVGDITKQYLYELAYKEFASENNLKITTNAFLMPTESNEVIRLGNASMELFDSNLSVKLNNIEIILLPHVIIYDYYLSDYHIKDFTEMEN